MTYNRMIADLISASILPLWGYPIFLAVTSKNYGIMGIVIGAGLVSLGIEGFKKLVDAWAPNYGPFRRPADAMNCSLLNSGGFVGGASGFPSGHTATAAFLATALFYDSRPLARMLAFAYVIAVAVSRLAKSCHTLLHVVAGGIIGLAAGMAYRAWISAKN